MKHLILKKDISCNYGRLGTVIMREDVCQITKEKCLCVCCDSSEGEYGEIIISLEYLNKKAKDYENLDN